MSDLVTHYAVFWQEQSRAAAMWCRARTKRAAVAQARKVRGYVVRVNYGSRDAWDAPTFKVCGDVVADYRG